MRPWIRVTTVRPKLRFLHESCPVANAGAFELREFCERLTVSRSCRDDHGASGYRCRIVQSHAVLLLIAIRAVCWELSVENMSACFERS